MKIHITLNSHDIINTRILGLENSAAGHHDRGTGKIPHEIQNVQTSQDSFLLYFSNNKRTSFISKKIFIPSHLTTTTKY